MRFHPFDIRVGVVAGAVGWMAAFGAGASAAGPGRDHVLAAMKRASGFMMDTVSERGGFVETYTADLSERWGEVPARRSMIWVQEPGTVSVGRVLLEAYQGTKDNTFLEQAQRTADALIAGQHPAGGWHYFIDFDPSGIEKWYAEVGSRCWGWEEYYHYDGNCTFDDNVTTGAADFLLDLFMETKSVKHRVALDKAIGFILKSQYPEGGWPQRYPLREGYSSYFTFNDGVTTNNIYFLLKADRLLGNVAYKRAAIRGMQFVVISQMGAPQAGWGMQHDLDLRPAGARSYEPAGLSPSTTAENIGHLMRFYQITGDRRHLRGIPDAIAWLDKAKLPEGHSDQGHTHGQFLELNTDRPLYAHREGTGIENGRYWVDHEPANFPGHYGMQVQIDVAALRRKYERVSGLSPGEAMAEHRAATVAKSAVQEVDGENVRAAIEAMDERGAWVEDLSVLDYHDWKGRPRREFRGISTRTFVTNMRMFVGYLRQNSGK
jgi:PelA/Pel-15E family pectate lyase